MPWTNSTRKHASVSYREPVNQTTWSSRVTVLVAGRPWGVSVGPSNWISRALAAWPLWEPQYMSSCTPWDLSTNTPDMKGTCTSSSTGRTYSQVGFNYCNFCHTHCLENSTFTLNVDDNGQYISLSSLTCWKHLPFHATLITWVSVLLECQPVATGKLLSTALRNVGNYLTVEMT